MLNLIHASVHLLSHSIGDIKCSNILTEFSHSLNLAYYLLRKEVSQEVEYKTNGVELNW